MRADGRTTAGLAVVTCLTVLAYHHSLGALLATVSTDTPLAYLGLIPLLALGVALVKARPRPGEGRLPHRQADWIIGVPLLLVAAFVAVALPDRLSYEFWTNRIDMLGLPFFAAGLVSIVLGSRVLFRLRLPLAALALAWPLPYELVLDRVLALASGFTLAAVRLAVPLLDVGRSAGGTLFALGSGAQEFQVNVAPQCAGASSALGFLLVGGAITGVLGGSRRGKTLWLLTGLTVQLLSNVGRILLVFAVGHRYGEQVAIEWLHPYIGLVLFTVSMAVLVLLLPRFGVPLTLPAAAESVVPQRVRAMPVVTCCALLLALPNGGLRKFDPYLGVGSASPYRSLALVPASFDGWQGRHTDTISWARPYFGASSSWERLTYVAARGAPEPVFVDVVNSGDLRAFSRYGLEACYRFHDYDVVDSGTASVGAPARAQTLAYRSDGAGSWAVVSWVWPVGARRFERVVVMGAFDGTPEGARRSGAELLGFSRALVASQRLTT